MSPTELDLSVVVAEIEAEVARRRASGELPAALEAELDAEFANYAPAAVAGDMGAVLTQAEQASHIDADVPTAGRFPFGYVKVVLRKLMFWYANFLANQVSSFGSAAVRALRMLDRRVTRLERSVPGGHPGLVAALDEVDPEPLPDAWLDAATEAFAGARGRVLHADCGDGTLLRRLRAAGCDAYGCEPRRRLLASGLRDGFDIRPDDAVEHLGAMAAGSLHGVVLSGVVDAAPAGTQVALIELAARALAPGGRLVLLASDPAAWRAHVGPVVADLAPGHPLHAETWAHLCRRAGLVLERTEASRGGTVVVAGKPA